MPFSIKLQDIVAIDESGGTVLNPRIQHVINAKRLPGKVQYHLSRIGKRLFAEVSTYQEQRLALVKEFGEEKLDDGKPTDQWTVLRENVAAYFEKNKAMLDTVIEIDLNPIKFAELGEVFEGTTPDDFIDCDGFILQE